MKLYTIGFTQKTAQEFFETLRKRQVQVLVDIRLRPGGQLAGFAKQDDLPYFLEQLVDGCQYRHLPELAPTKEILDGYRADQDWPGYADRFEALLDERHIPNNLDQELFKKFDCCLLCSEASADKCHRRLVAERLAAAWPEVVVIHL